MASLPSFEPAAPIRCSHSEADPQSKSDALDPSNVTPLLQSISILWSVSFTPLSIGLSVRQHQ
jgi:hypothetical protein